MLFSDVVGDQNSGSGHVRVGFRINILEMSASGFQGFVSGIFKVKFRIG